MKSLTNHRRHILFIFTVAAQIYKAQIPTSPAKEFYFLLFSEEIRTQFSQTDAQSKYANKAPARKQGSQWVEGKSQHAALIRVSMRGPCFGESPPYSCTPVDGKLSHQGVFKPTVLEASPAADGAFDH